MRILRTCLLAPNISFTDTLIWLLVLGNNFEKSLTHLHIEDQDDKEPQFFHFITHI